MKKYKHKQSNSIAEQTDHIRIYKVNTDLGEVTHVPSSLIENTNDWEEIKEEPFIQQTGRMTRLKDDCIKHVSELKKEIDVEQKEIKEEPNYLITAFRFKDSLDIWDLKKNGFYGANPIVCEHTLEEMLMGNISVSDDRVEIYSVKNSKGEEFVLSETVKFSLIKLPIIKFEILSHNFNEMCVILSNENRYTLEDITKIKSPIYTTTDGVEIFEGDYKTIYLISKEQPSDECKVCAVLTWSKEDSKVADRYLTFTSEENRDKYIKENIKKPVLVAADSKELFEGDIIYHFYKPFEFIMHKSILRHNTIYGDVVFYKEESAKEYIDNNKPKYSLADIEKCYPSPSGYENRIKDIPLVATLFNNLKKLGK